MLQKQFDNFMNQNFDKAISSGVALAVSGGCDSIALLFLASKWAKKNLVRLVIFSVNHRLREESDKEIEFVKKTVLDLGHEFIGLTWLHDNTKNGLQERARKARYEMMGEKCHEVGINNLLTAHHYDDFLENYFMRKRKKSGILGLCNSYSTFYNNIQVLRPLYNIKKQNLIDYLQANSISWMEDESNNLDFYERNRVRKYISSLSGKAKTDFEEEANIADVAARGFNSKFIKAIAETVEFNRFGFAFIDLTLYKELDYEITVYLINFVLTSISGGASTPRYRSAKKLLDAINSGNDFACSLHGCILRRLNDKLLIYREKNKISNHSLNLKNGVVWDNRFQFNLRNDFIAEGFEVCKLCMGDYVKIKDKLDFQKIRDLSKNNYKDILFTLPVIKTLEKIIAIPHISYYDNFKCDSGVDIVFGPIFVSRFTHFL